MTVRAITSAKSNEIFRWNCKPFLTCPDRRFHCPNLRLQLGRGQKRPLKVRRRHTARAGENGLALFRSTFFYLLTVTRAAPHITSLKLLVVRYLLILNFLASVAAYVRD